MDSKPKAKGRSSPAIDEAFERFWAAYPKRDMANPRKPAAEKFAVACKNGVDPEDIIAGAQAYARQLQAAGKIGTSYVAQAVTWLNQVRWADEIGAANGSANGQAPLVEDDELWSKRLRWSRDKKLWSREVWGPMPGEPNSRVPMHLQQPGDGEGWAEFEEQR